MFEFGDGPRLLVHLSQAGRLDLETPPKRTRGGKGGVVRLRFGDDETAVLVREYGTERKAAWWVLAPGDDGPLARLGPEPDTAEFEDLVRDGTDRRRIHTLLRDQATVAGVGRGYADDALLARRAVALRDAGLPRRRAAGRARRRGARRARRRPRAGADP